MNMTFKRERRQQFKYFKLETSKPIRTKFLQSRQAYSQREWTFLDGPTTSPTNLRWRTAAILDFVKC